MVSRPAELDLLEQRGGRLRVVHLREVVRDVGDEAQRVVAPLPQPDLEQRLGAGRDPQLAAPRALAGAAGSGLLAWWVIAIGRVCGTAIGTEPMLTTRVTPNRSTTSRTARAKASQRMSGSGPCSSRYGVPPVSRSSRTTSRGAS